MSGGVKMKERGKEAQSIIAVLQIAGLHKLVSLRSLETHFSMP
jgi:hypothetical protein